MASLDNLPADQRAVLALVLGRGRSYDEIAQMLSIDRGAVRQRALAAFDALGPQTRVPAERRALITDYLLGQLPSPLTDEMRLRLAESASERAWARVLSSEIAPLVSGPLPEISAAVVEPEPPEPAAEASSPPAVADAGRQSPIAAASSQAPIAVAPSAPEPAPDDGEHRVAPRADRGPNVSRVGGAVLIGIAVGAVIAVVVIVAGLSSGTGHRSPTTTAVAGDSSQTTTGTTSAANPATTTSTTASAQVVAQINLTPPTSTSKAVGIAEVLKEGATDGIAIVAQKVAPNTTKPPNAYAVWLYNSPADAYFLGFVNPGVGSNERLSTAGGLPSHAARYKDLIVTLENQASPKTPGTIILQGALKGL